jgi:hypothetical protein
MALWQGSLAVKATSSPGMRLSWLKKVLKILCVMVIRPKIHGDISPGKDAPTRAQPLCLYDDMQIVNLN